MAPGGDGGVGAGRGGHDQHRAGPGEGQGGRVQEEEGGEAGDVHHQHGGSLEIQTSSKPKGEFIFNIFVNKFQN